MGARTGAVDLLDAGEVAVAGLVDAHLRPRLEHPQQSGHQPLRHPPPPLPAPLAGTGRRVRHSPERAAASANRGLF
jgi:hypothetical protein